MSTPFIIAIDSREGLPYDFNSLSKDSYRFSIKALETGDYSIVGLEDKVAIERKSLEDLIGTFTRRRRAFYNEIYRMCKHEHRCVVVEGNLIDIHEKNYRSEINPSAILGTIMHILVDFKIPVFFCGTRQVAEDFVLRYLLRAYKNLTKE